MSEMYLTRVTPEMAVKWLEKKTDKRRLNPMRINALARIISDGHWVLDGTPIRFALDGTLLDGRYRLEAIVKSGVTCESYVVEGLPTQETIDTGRVCSRSEKFKALTDLYGNTAGK